MLKDTLTGHNGAIYACKFISGTKLATGSADRLIKTWDLQSRQCELKCQDVDVNEGCLSLGVRTLFAGSKCHDLAIIDATGAMASGHFDKKIRIWDPFTDVCRAEVPCDAVVTSLFYNAGMRRSWMKHDVDDCLLEKQQLLACLRDDTLKLIDLRQNKSIYSFR